jgi:hypothetical protein
MDWCHLEGVERVMAAYREWRQYSRELRECSRDLRCKKDGLISKDLLKTHKRFLKEDVQIELDELIDSILSLTPKEHQHLLNTVKSDKLYRLLSRYS